MGTPLAYRPNADDSPMGTPLVRCSSCERGWHSATMADGLRTIGSCPRCGGTLVFAAPPPEADAEDRVHTQRRETAPHLVLGLPRR